jgi:hypothetical protein
VQQENFLLHVLLVRHLFKTRAKSLVGWYCRD